VSHYLGIDIGTFEAKAVLADRQGRIVASAARPHKLIVPQPGWAEHRPIEDWWDGFASLSRRVIAESGVAPKDIKAVGASAIGPCMLPVDADGEPLMNGVLYGVDTRAAREIEDLTREIGADTILDRCGNALTSQSVGPKILWLKRNRPDIFARTRKVHTSTSFLVRRLTGKDVIDHYTAANASPFYLADELAFSDRLAPGLLSLDLMPDLAWTTDIAGSVTPKAAEATGLFAGTPVTVGTIDAAAEALSVGILDAGDMMLMYGSTIFVIMIASRRLRDPRLWYAPWLFPGQHGAMAGLATSGTLTHWFRDQFARELDPSSAMPALAEEAAASPPGARGLLFLPYFSGERTPIHDPLAKGMLIGLNLTHTRADVYRSMLEGIAHATRHVFDTYREAGEEPRTIYSVGGGTRNRVWSQATSDITGRVQILREKSIGASYGDAFLAALAIGDVRREEIAAWNPVSSEVVPAAATKDAYAEAHGIYRELYPATRDLMHRLG
jgi:xylulokinase